MNPVPLHYEIRGSGPPLVLLMGLGADGPVWARHVEAYQRHFTCILVDNRGVGRSPKPSGPYSTAAMADDVAAVLDRLGVEHALVNGISMGGAIAQSLALRHPGKVAKLVLVCSWAACDAYARSVFEQFKHARAAARPEEFVRLLQLWIWSPAYFDRHETELAEVRAAASAADNLQPQAAFAAQCDACQTHDTRADLGRIAVPTLVTAGERDIFTPLPFSHELHARIHGSTLSVFAGAGHAHHWEQCERFNRETIAFLQAR